MDNLARQNVWRIRSKIWGGRVWECWRRLRASDWISEEGVFALF